MSDNKTKPTNVDVDAFLSTTSERRRTEARVLVDMMRHISGATPTMWGPSIIGFGSQHYTYDTGREGDMPRISFSPRKAAITVYFAEGFDRYSALLPKLGKYKSSVSCLYINKLEDIDNKILRQMLEQSYRVNTGPLGKPTTVNEYIDRVPAAARPQFDELRSLVSRTLSNAQEVVSYGILGYKIDDKRPRVFISGWKDHTAMYPLPKNAALRTKLKPYIKGKGTLWFPLDKSLPKALLEATVQTLVK